MYNKQPKEVDTEFVLDQLNKVRDELEKTQSRMDMMYASVLYVEAEKYVRTCKTITSDKLQRKFQIGYLRTSYLIDMLTKHKVIALDKSKAEDRVYIVQASEQ